MLTAVRDWLMVYEISPDTSSTEVGRAHYQLIWKLFAQTIEARYPGEWKMEGIVYGQMPKGFTQQVPETGPPPPLLEGKTHEVDILAKWNGYPKPIRFQIRKGKAVQVPL